jgi:Protein of unknown function (DUF3592)
MAGKDVAIFCAAAGWLMVVGWLWLLFGRWKRRRIERLRQVGYKTSGVVVGHDYIHSSSMDAPVPVPLVQFQAPDGRLVTASSDVANMAAPRKGDRVTVLFDPDRPKQVHIDSGAGDEPDMVDKIGVVLAWVFIGGGAITIVVVLLLYLFLW